MVVAGLITFIAAVHYMYMRDFWVATGESPTVYRYIDWILTVPLQMVEFFLILVAAGAAVPGQDSQRSFTTTAAGQLTITCTVTMTTGAGGVGQGSFTMP